MSTAIKVMAQAMERVEAKMNRERYKLPAHKREKYFGGYREGLAEAKVRAALEAIRHLPVASINQCRAEPTKDRVDYWCAMIDGMLRQ